jgi:hypothetical protein
MAVNLLRPTPPCLPHLGVVGEPAGPTGCQLSKPSPRPNTSLGPPTWASVARGDVYARVEKTTCIEPPPAVTAAEFSALFERCMASGLKAHMVISHAARCQAINVMCSLPVPAKTATTAGGCSRHRHRRRRVDALPPLRVLLQRKHHLWSLLLQSAEKYFRRPQTTASLFA